MDEKKINIVFMINKKYIPYMAVTAASILKNSTNNVFFNFYILSSSDLNDDLQKIEIYGYSNFKIINKVINEPLDKNICSKLPNHVTIESALRLYAPKLLTDVEKCIILDVDLIINHDIEKLYNIDIENFFAGGGLGLYPKVTEVNLKFRYDFIKKYKLKDNLYFNTGVLLLNLNKIRSDGAELLLLDTMHKYGNDNLRLFDQDLINIAYQGMGRGMIKPIDPRWCVF